MRKYILITFIAFITGISYGQVFNSAGTLSKKTFSVGVEPTIFPDGDFMLFFYGGYGIKSGLDLNLKLGVGGTNYYGIDAEWALKRNISVIGGFHHFGDPGVDGTLLFNIPIKNDSKFYTGVDADLVFPEGDIQVPLWIPMGIEINIKNTTSFIFEFELAVTDDAYHVLGGGMVFYF